jgi:uncharacterized protein YuzE
MPEGGHMRGRYLDVTFRHGRPLAAYLHLPRRPGRKTQTTRRAGEGLVVDLDVDGRPIGIEITAPQTLTLAALNEILSDYHLPESTQEELTPLGVA